MKKIRIATRDSKLALWQAQWVQDRLSSYYPDREFLLAPIKTKGDQILNIGLAKIGDKGLFTRELEQALFTGEVDMAVHSLKDLPTNLFGGLEIGAFCERQDPRDVFVNNDGKCLSELPPGSLIGTSSLRRKAQLQHYRQDLTFRDLRGNLETRWRKLQESSELAGMVLAAAGVLRLGWEHRITEFLSEDILLPAVGQGVIAVEIASYRTDMRQILQPLNHKETELAARAERSFLRSLEGGCQVPIGALASMPKGKICLRGMVASVDGRVVLETSQEGFNPEDVGIGAAEEMKRLGGEALLEQVRSNS